MLLVWCHLECLEWCFLEPNATRTMRVRDAWWQLENMDVLSALCLLNSDTKHRSGATSRIDCRGRPKSVTFEGFQTWDTRCLCMTVCSLVWTKIFVAWIDEQCRFSVVDRFEDYLIILSHDTPQKKLLTFSWPQVWSRVRKSLPMSALHSQSFLDYARVPENVS